MQNANASSVKICILIANLVTMLFPPIPLWFAQGSMSWALTYFFGSGILLVLSMFVLRSLDGPVGEE